jgi:diaminopimelate epimerase
LVQFHKYHALGNDYIVLDPTEIECALTPEAIRQLCHRHCGIGSDGILLGPLMPASDEFQALAAAAGMPDSSGVGWGLRIFNPDGSEAEKSGNGLRIFCRYLWDTKRVSAEPFRLLTLGGVVGCTVLDEGRAVRVEMGRVSFDSAQIPVAGPPREVINETIEVLGEPLVFCAATVGNPHCVILRDTISEAETCRLGPPLEIDPRFPNRTNVQFMQVRDRNNIAIEIWERGAGYTLASGSSASACAAVACKLGLCDADITVHMPGGELQICVDEQYGIVMRGPVSAVAHGVVAEDLVAATGATELP